MNRRAFVSLCGSALLAVTPLAGLAKDKDKDSDGGKGKGKGKDKDVFVIKYRKAGDTKVLTERILASGLNAAREKFRKDHPHATILSVVHLP